MYILLLKLNRYCLSFFYIQVEEGCYVLTICFKFKYTNTSKIVTALKKKNK